MDVTLDGREIEESELQEEKALLGILASPAG
jgi:hypothetical protein